MIWLDLLFALSGGVVGFLWGRRLRPQYRCSTCRHGIGFHTNRSGWCHAFAWDGACDCQNYIGEQPPPTYEEMIGG
jgi:hypothetical protein